MRYSMLLQSSQRCDGILQIEWYDCVLAFPLIRDNIFGEPSFGSFLYEWIDGKFFCGNHDYGLELSICFIFAACLAQVLQCLLYTRFVPSGSSRTRGYQQWNLFCRAYFRVCLFLNNVPPDSNVA